MLCHDSAGNYLRKTHGSHHDDRVRCRIQPPEGLAHLPAGSPRCIRGWRPCRATCSQMPPSLMEGSGRFMSSGERPGTRLKLMATT